ncbi:MAG: FimB/Mfa2 family fimbrial subunit [Bacteroides sp.]|nr:FimB/Mfa2 family fimbrial subunit [Bacteroides sp.]
MSKINKIIFLCFALSFLLTACIREDLSDCPLPWNVDLSFLYYGDGEEDIFPRKVERVTVYVMDHSYSSIRRYEVGKNELNNRQGIQLQLPQGEYHAVCWGNAWRAGEEFHSREIQELTDYLLVHGEDGKEITTMDSLYYGRASFRVDAKGTVTETITFASAHIDMEIHLRGWKHLSPDETKIPQVEIIGLPIRYDFSMDLSGEPGVVVPALEKDGKDILSGYFSLLRFPDENPIEIHIRQKEGEIFYTLSLQSFMETHQIRVEGIHEITIPVYFSFGSHGVEVGVDPWDSVSVQPDL